MVASLRRVALVLPLVGPGARRMSGAIAQAPPRSLLHLLGPVRRTLRPPATARQVLAILTALDEQEIRYWVAGGWGVDALAGHQSRHHDDVDIVLDDFERTVGRAAEALFTRGFAVVERELNPTWMPDRWHLEDRANCHVELVSLDLPLLQRAAEAFPAGRALAPFGTGTIGGREVPCLGADAQCIVHSGYPTRPVDRHDLGLLQLLRSSTL